ncbi:Gfo/Idh/MocA family protein [Mucilaginibacter gotjawali]|uniref:Inositol 2-dehydrogenase n=2 Tax=Mucilaginibacter gotjawali TaxID=1550579 RepID=A0A120MXX9_9SPHI|nr:Gfo/Idh/MocA family oxidoreductase [Mucilaginibacter gotjawali]MBB3059121.1 putative dehydrogenase [Mucilaginibacter gotjawali]BAU52227.1 Inositol 2-dehydrogenase [Mucilaginibacter gotjawali]
MSSDRRKFLKQLGGTIALTSATLSSFAAMEEHEYRILQAEKRYSANDKVRIATIGLGIMGYNDTRTALACPGVELVGCCDLYTGRLDHAKEVFGAHIFTTKDYHEILDRNDVDAVIIATSDNWHSTIAKAAMRKGKAVYSEKPMVHYISEGLDEIKTQQETKAVFQVGSQRVSSLAFKKAKELYQSGAIGQINSIEASFNRQSALGAWQYTIPLDASPQTVDWNRYTAKDQKKLPYDSNRFFRWRNYREYGTGVAGDLFVHLLSGIHFITDSKGPDKIFAIGGTYYWKDGRNVPDVMSAVIEYPHTKEHPAFQAILRVNFISGEGDHSSTKIIGSEGVLDLSDEGGGFTIRKNKMPVAPGIDGWDSFGTYTTAMQKALMDDYNKKYSAADQQIPNIPGTTYHTPAGYDANIDHFNSFFDGIRLGKPIVEDAVFGFRAAAPALACNDSYFQNKVIHWDAEHMRLG